MNIDRGGHPPPFFLIEITLPSLFKNNNDIFKKGDGGIIKKGGGIVKREMVFQKGRGGIGPALPIFNY